MKGNLMTPDFGSKEAGSKGGKAAAKRMTPAERSARARKAAEAKWSKEGKVPPPTATHSGELTLGEMVIDCHVLEDKSRVISTRGVMKALGRRWRGRKYSGTTLPVFLEAKNLAPFITEELLEDLSPVDFRTASGARAEGLRAEVLPKVCEVYLQARDAKDVLTEAQIRVALQAEILMRGLAHVGIVALVDEATGYQRDRERNDLAKILEAFVAKELQKWLRTFPLEFYELVCEVRNEPIQRAYKRPAYFGHITNNLVYARLAPGVLQELRRKNPVVDAGNRRHKHFQYLTPDMGHPKLKEHLEGVKTALKIAKKTGTDWDGFLELLDETHPKFVPLPLFDGPDEDQGD